jgi:hypothetical protein
MFEYHSTVWVLAAFGPLCLVWLVGIAVALITWRKHRLISLLAFVAFVLQLLQSMAGIGFSYWVREQTTGAGSYSWASNYIGPIANGIGVLQTSLSAISWVMIVLAIFRWHTQPNRTLGHDGQYLPEGFFGATIEPIQPGDHNVSRRPNP